MDITYKKISNIPLFKNFEDVAKELSLDLTLRPQNLSNLTYYKICSYYEKLFKKS